MNKELIEIVGKKSFLADEKSFNSQLEYVKGIPSFDAVLNGETQQAKGFVIHFIEYPKGFLIKLTKHFSSIKYGISYNQIDKINLIKFNDCVILNIKTDISEVLFKLEYSSLFKLQDFINSVGIQANLKESIISKNNNYFATSSSAIDLAIKNVNKDYKIGIWTTLVFCLVTIFIKLSGVGKQYNYGSGSSNANEIFFWAFLVITIIAIYFCLLYFPKQKLKVQNILKGDYHLWFKYNNGDELIIADNLIIPFCRDTHFKEPIKKIKGISWGLNHIKDGLKDLSEGDLPISLLIPNVKVSSNKLPIALHLGHFGGDEFFIYYVDIKEVKLLLIILINEKTKSEKQLSFPISDEIKFSKKEFDILTKKISLQNKRFGSLYIDKEIFNKINNN